MGGTEADDDDEGNHHHMVLQSMLESGQDIEEYSKKMQLHLEYGLCCFTSTRKSTIVDEMQCTLLGKQCSLLATQLVFGLHEINKSSTSAKQANKN